MVLGGFSVSGGGIVDHGKLNGLGDDDHVQYSLVDGTRAFTGTVGGITPSASGDLATKGYVDGAIVTDHGALSGLADDDHTQYAEIASAESITAKWDMSGGNLVLPTSASPPGSPSEGQVYYDTADDIAYYYDSSRSKWLSFESVFVEGLRDVSSLSAGYLKTGGMAYQALLGFVMSRDFCVVSGGVRSLSSEAGDQMQIRADGTSIATVSFNALGDTKEGYSTTLNGNGTAGQVVSLYMNAATNKMMAWAQIKWRN